MSIKISNKKINMVGICFFLLVILSKMSKKIPKIAKNAKNSKKTASLD